VQLRPLLEQGEIEAAIRERAIAGRVAADLRQAEAKPVKARKRGRVRAHEGEIAYPRHRVCSGAPMCLRHPARMRCD
jgi:hypothetical protein